MSVSRMLELTVISVKDLKKTNLIGKMDVYAVVSLLGDTRHKYKKQRTPVHRVGGGSRPQSVAFMVGEAKLDDLMVVFALYHKRTLGRDKEVGHVVVPVSNLLRKKGQSSSEDSGTFRYKVRTRSGEDHGELEFSVKFPDSDSDSTLPPPPPPPPAVVDADPQPEQTSWVSTYRRRHHAHHKRNGSW